MPEKETVLTASEEKRMIVTNCKEIKKVLNECTKKDAPFQIIKPGSGNVKEHFCSDFYRSELFYQLDSLNMNTEYSMIIQGDSIKPRYVLSFTAEDVDYLVLKPRTSKVLTQIFLKS